MGTSSYPSCFRDLQALYEKLGAKVATILGADAMPNVIFMATVVYEANLCIALGSGFDWLIFFELVMFDFVENMYCLYSLENRLARRKRKPRTCSLLVRWRCESA